MFCSYLTTYISDPKHTNKSEKVTNIFCLKSKRYGTSLQKIENINKSSFVKVSFIDKCLIGSLPNDG